MRNEKGEKEMRSGKLAGGGGSALYMEHKDFLFVHQEPIKNAIGADAPPPRIFRPFHLFGVPGIRIEGKRPDGIRDLPCILPRQLASSAEYAGINF